MKSVRWLYEKLDVEKFYWIYFNGDSFSEVHEWMAVMFSLVLPKHEFCSWHWQYFCWEFGLFAVLFGCCLNSGIPLVTELYPRPHCCFKAGPVLSPQQPAAFLLWLVWWPSSWTDSAVSSFCPVYQSHPLPLMLESIYLPLKVKSGLILTLLCKKSDLFTFRISQHVEIFRDTVGCCK